MPSFGSSAVETISFDLTAWGGPKGNIVEPSTAIVNQALKKLDKSVEQLSEVQQDIDLLDTKSEDYQVKYRALTQKVRDMSDEMFDNIANETVDAVALICGGSPSKEDIESLPHRVQQEFCKFILKEFINPEGLTAVTSQLSDDSKN